MAELHAWVPPMCVARRRESEKLGKIAVQVQPETGTSPTLAGIPAQPLASAVARHHASTGHRVTNLRHERVKMDGFDRFLLSRLDGSRDLSALVDDLIAGPVTNGVLSINDDQRAASDEYRAEDRQSTTDPPRLTAANGDSTRPMLAEEVEKRALTLNKKIKIAVMGCVVNGPGESREADIGIAGGVGEGLIYKKGVAVKKVPEAEMLDYLMQEIERM